MALFLQRMRVDDRTTILDVGGTADTWTDLPVRPRVTLLNMPRAGVSRDQGFETVGADGCCLPFRDHAFDVVFSNSVIEHVGSSDRQQSFAAEVCRVGKAWWVQTPNRWYPIEAHLLTPGVHFLPKAWQRAALARGTVWEFLERPSADRREFYYRHFLEDIRLLGAGELQELFPEAHILRERFLGLTKSLIAAKFV